MMMVVTKVHGHHHRGGDGVHRPHPLGRSSCDALASLTHILCLLECLFFNLYVYVLVDQFETHGQGRTHLQC